MASAANRADDGPLTALTDFSFKKYATPTLIKIIYIVLLIAVGLGLLIGLGSGVVAMAFTLETAYSDEEVAAGILSSIVIMIASLLGSLVSVLLVRTGLEFVIASIRTARNTETILDELAEIKAQGTKI